MFPVRIRGLFRARAAGDESLILRPAKVNASILPSFVRTVVDSAAASWQGEEGTSRVVLHGLQAVKARSLRLTVALVFLKLGSSVS